LNFIAVKTVTSRIPTS